MSAIIDALADHARSAPAAEALRSAGRTLSYGELVERVNDTAAILRSRGCRRIGLMADNGIDWIVADLAALASGITVIPLPPFFSDAQLRHLLQHADTDTLIADGSAAEARVRAFGFGQGIHSLGRDLSLRQRRLAAATDPDGESTAKVTFTSGSTGRPKGVRLSADTLDQVTGRLRDALGGLGIGNHLCVAPLAVLLENIAGVYVPLTLGATVHVPSLSSLGLYGTSRTDIRRFDAAIRDAQAESLILQPQLLRELTLACESGELRPDSLRYVAVGGARVAEADLEAAMAAGIPAYQGYGLSETGSVVAINRPGDARAGSVGRPLPGVSVTLAEDGEILVTGQRMLGYLGNASGPCSDAPLATGDIGHLDEDGYLYVTGRKRNVFITSFGRNVSPEWPEAELLHEPALAQACIFGESRPFNTAVVVPVRPGTDDDAIERAVHAANGRLPDYARVTEWIRATEPFSVGNGLLTATGKPCREAVERRYIAGDAGLTPRALGETRADTINSVRKELT